MSDNPNPWDLNSVAETLSTKEAEVRDLVVKAVTKNTVTKVLAIVVCVAGVFLIADGLTHLGRRGDSVNSANVKV